MNSLQKVAFFKTRIVRSINMKCKTKVINWSNTRINAYMNKFVYLLVGKRHYDGGASIQQNEERGQYFRVQSVMKCDEHKCEPILWNLCHRLIPDAQHAQLNVQEAAKIIHYSLETIRKLYSLDLPPVFRFRQCLKIKNCLKFGNSNLWMKKRL